MNSVFLDAQLTDEQRRSRLYEGALHVINPTPNSLELCRFAQQLAGEAFAPHDPEHAQDDVPVEEYVEILAQLKPKFIHHPRCKELIRGMLADVGCDIERTYFDVPRLRTMTHGNYLTAGLAYAFHPHRDTWFSAPPCQLNWWLPVYDISADNTIAFLPRYWNKPIANTSRDYNYYKWNQESRRAAASQIKTDTRKQPQALEPIDMESQIRVVCKAGGLILFSGAYLHATVPNASTRTRFSIDFRTVHLDDVIDGRGAENIDSECTGTTLRDFLRASDSVRLPDDIAAEYDTTPAEGELICAPA
jgi:Phytanoyl-CoA dioxygenase (PhyH)